MKSLRIILIALLFFGVGISGASGATIGLFDWGLNIDGSLTLPGDPLPPSVNAGGFDFGTGLGTISLNIDTPGAHSVLGFFDHEIDEAVNTWFNENGLATGAPAAGQSWEIDEPGYFDGDIYENFQASLLDNGIGTSVYGNTFFPDDVSMAMGWDFNLAAGEYALLSFVLSDTDMPSGFYLTHSDPDSGASIYFSSNLNVVPEPGTIILLGSGLVGLIGMGRRRFKKTI